MKTLSDIKREVAKAGGSVEEDFGRRDMRSLQVIAPKGKVWAGNGCQCMPVQWAKGSTPHAIAHNESAFRDIEESLSHGSRAMTEEESYLTAED